jgi:hypothetical protein
LGKACNEVEEAIVKFLSKGWSKVLESINNKCAKSMTLIKVPSYNNESITQIATRDRDTSRDTKRMEGTRRQSSETRKKTKIKEREKERKIPPQSVRV